MAKSTIIIAKSTIIMAKSTIIMAKSTIIMGKSTILMAKSTISMAIFNSFLYVYLIGYLSEKSEQPYFFGISPVQFARGIHYFRIAISLKEPEAKSLCPPYMDVDS